MVSHKCMACYSRALNTTFAMASKWLKSLSRTCTDALSKSFAVGSEVTQTRISFWLFHKKITTKILHFNSLRYILKSHQNSQLFEIICVSDSFSIIWMYTYALYIDIYWNWRNVQHGNTNHKYCMPISQFKDTTCQVLCICFRVMIMDDNTKRTEIGSQELLCVEKHIPLDE